MFLRRRVLNFASQARVELALSLEVKYIQLLRQRSVSREALGPRMVRLMKSTPV
jgi:hypothetical protein